MVLTAEIRRQKLAALSAQQEKKVATQKLYYKSENRAFSVFKIDLDWLIYNRHNGRLDAEMQTWEQENAASPDVYDDELHSLIDDFLWKSNTGRNQSTLRDLEKKGQQRPGIVSLDGVIIDGNRRAMLLRRLEKKRDKQYFEAVILPDAYHENEGEIVRLETQYQLGEDDKVEYGPLQKYLRAKRLRYSLNIKEDEIAQLMGISESEVKDLLGIMDLMDDYLQHIDCAGLYTMLKEQEGSTKEGMFVDLYADLTRLRKGSPRVEWDYDKEVDTAELQTIQFDYVRYGSDFSTTNKSYREISHGGKGRNFFAQKEIWDSFANTHRSEVVPISMSMGTLAEYMAKNRDFQSRVEAARARDDEWRETIKAPIQRNFGLSSEKLEAKVNELEPRQLLQRAKSALERIDVNSAAFTSDPANIVLVKDVNNLTYQMKRALERC